jgi:hypothetical protein
MNPERARAALHSVRGFDAMAEHLDVEEIKEMIEIESSALRRKTMLNRLHRALRVATLKKVRRELGIIPL